MATIVKATSKGQVTLPAKWRRGFDTNQFLIKELGDKLIISPIDMDQIDKEEEWTTIFSADRDNKGKGVPIDDFINALKKTL